MFKDGAIQDVAVRNLSRHIDARGWLTELFREDQLDPIYMPVMAYVSMTSPGIARGPHEHRDQADLFAFIGPSVFKIYLWDNRKDSPTFMTRQIVTAGEGNPCSVLIPRGIVHAYKNIGDRDGMVLNFPNRLYAGKGKKEPVDEIRHESDPNSVFRLE
ncbi:MAG: dTDP-4-dehydrorhamnose 3,5-epimerase family protein [Bacteroidota bacterium]